MKKSQYKKPVRKGKELLFYVCKIGRQKLSIIITTQESIYWRVRNRLQEMVDSGCLDRHFDRGQVFCQRVVRADKSKLTEKDKQDIIEKIKNNFLAISFDELAQAHKNNNASLEQFMSSDNVDENYYCEIEKLEKILPLKEVSKEEYFFHAVTERFPEFASKLKKEHKMLADSMELE
jgi:hypothetical protein